MAASPNIVFGAICAKPSYLIRLELVAILLSKTFAAWNWSIENFNPFARATKGPVAFAAKAFITNGIR